MLVLTHDGSRNSAFPSRSLRTGQTFLTIPRRLLILISPRAFMGKVSEIFNRPRYEMVWVGILLFVVVLPVHAQFETEPHPLDTFLKNVLDFSEPTGIRGTLRYWDEEEHTLWLNWDLRSDDRPLFITGWKSIPGEPTLAVHPTGPDQLQIFQQMPKGTPVEMVVQLDKEGKRRILSSLDLTLPRKVPLGNHW